MVSQLLGFWAVSNFWVAVVAVGLFFDHWKWPKSYRKIETIIHKGGSWRQQRSCSSNSTVIHNCPFIEAKSERLKESASACVLKINEGLNLDLSFTSFLFLEKQAFPFVFMMVGVDHERLRGRLEWWFLIPSWSFLLPSASTTTTFENGCFS